MTRPFEQKLTITHITPRLTSDPAPKLRTAATSPRRYSTVVPPKLTSGATSPRLEGHMAMSPWLPSSKMSSAANSPPHGHSISGSADRKSYKHSAFTSRVSCKFPLVPVLLMASSNCFPDIFFYKFCFRTHY